MTDYYQFEEVNQPAAKLFLDAKRQRDPSETVLDLGCGRARLGQEIERFGYRVTGVEANAVAIEVARGRITELLELDLTHFQEVEAALSGRRFDWLLASDVLEHLPYPVDALRFYQCLLKADGRLVVSVPNIALWNVRLGLLFGQFTYRDSGVLDRTHFRFFTIRTAKQMLEDAGFEVLSTTYDPGLVRAFLPIVKRIMGGKGESQDPGLILESKPYRIYLRHILPLENAICRLVPSLFAFRIVMLAKLTNSSAG